ncbi:S1C family serine protease [Melghirimyces algeriensis]|uniref:Trypsin-like peptidase domain-containing protein n=1 Tax=Melghirimyces algeriensis TaxID=910412 RepID=A0A521CI90_9BACL|nr:trypsin-like peptidase domain-containing protein [Melghirimyces algeriensis]SMO59112.1 Trypsin-like peptidase domain-containing protein [Melghirimyces algeriensis]
MRGGNGASSGFQVRPKHLIHMRQPQRRKRTVYSLSAHHPANTFVPVIRKVKHSVVAISAEERQSTATYSLWDRLLSEWGATPLEEPQEKKRQFGAGFVISPHGYILTNEHVIRKAERISVHLYDKKRSLPARIVWTEPRHDVAVIQVRSSNPLRPLPLGSSHLTEVGEWAIAIGNPLGLNHSVTLGVISGKDRPLQVQNRRFENVIQTDAAINPGNSGGPLINVLGQAIGVNTLMVHPSQSISFAIPIDEVKPLIRSYLEHR